MAAREAFTSNRTLYQSWKSQPHPPDSYLLCNAFTYCHQQISSCSSVCSSCQRDPDWEAGPRRIRALPLCREKHITAVLQNSLKLSAECRVLPLMTQSEAVCCKLTPISIASSLHCEKRTKKRWRAVIGTISWTLCFWFWRHPSPAIHCSKPASAASLKKHSNSLMAVCKRRIKPLASLFSASLSFAVVSAQPRSGSFSNWTRLAPLSTMMRPICRSLSQTGKIAQNNLLARISMVSRTICLYYASLLRFARILAVASLCILLF